MIPLRVPTRLPSTGPKRVSVPPAASISILQRASCISQLYGKMCQGLPSAAGKVAFFAPVSRSPRQKRSVCSASPKRVDCALTASRGTMSTNASQLLTNKACNCYSRRHCTHSQGVALSNANPVPFQVPHAPRQGQTTPAGWSQPGLQHSMQKTHPSHPQWSQPLLLQQHCPLPLLSLPHSWQLVSPTLIPGTPSVLPGIKP